MYNNLTEVLPAATGDGRWLTDGTLRPGVPRVVLYSHDTLGFGHLRRNQLLAGALRKCVAKPDILMIAGIREAGAFEMPPGVDCLALPAYAKGPDGDYRPRDLGSCLDSLTRLRARTIQAAVQAFDPDLMIVDNVPRGALCELDPTLKMLEKRGRAHLVLGLRDVIDNPVAVRRQWLRQRNFEILREFYSEVWVYGDAAFYDLIDDCGLAGELRGKARFVGYLDQSVRLESCAAARTYEQVIGPDRRPYVLVSVGGGRDGVALCETFVQASLPAGHRAILIVGLQMARDERERVRQLALGNRDLSVIDFVDEPIALMAGADRIVAMGGYNTVSELLSLGRPALIVPRARPRAEQVLRAERLATRGLIEMIHPDALSADSISSWLAADRPRPPPAREILDMGGLLRVQQLVEEILTQPYAHLSVAAN